MPLDTATTTIIAAAIGGGVASIVAGGFALWNLWLTRRSEERRQIRLLAVQVALENWKIYKSVADQQSGFVPPIDTFLIHAVYLVSALDGSLKTEQQIREHLKGAFAAASVADKEVDEHNKRIQEARE